MIASLKYVVALLSLALVTGNMNAQYNTAKPVSQDTLCGKSLMGGGMWMGNSGFGLLKAGMEYGHWGTQLEVSADGLWKKYVQDHSSERALCRSISLSQRAYLWPGGRGPFVEAGIAWAWLSLGVKDSAGIQASRQAQTIMPWWNIGYRLVHIPKGVFGEIGFRSRLALSSIYLYTPPVMGEAHKNSGIGYHAWYIQPGFVMPQLYVGAGYAF